MEILRVLLMGKNRSKQVQQAVEKRMAEGLCLVPGCNRRSDEPGGGCGRCSKHYQGLRLELMNLPLEKKMAIRFKHIKAGTLLDQHEIRQFKVRESKAS